ncbi:hypothetical protein LI90_4398 [Carbonactinospora thermoautotrophica]|uniref:Uncharacterized protein n=1 Tax=Carbonactinospora thermoautotrophica TaxID=1469144 RepID=A0A132MHJ8_9ACTN|nr:hypothetical protein LI90_4398 [Carbonactinospora thermoautotrophica]
MRIPMLRAGSFFPRCRRRRRVDQALFAVVGKDSPARLEGPRPGRQHGWSPAGAPGLTPSPQLIPTEVAGRELISA